MFQLNNVNDGDTKVIKNKVYWKYLKQGKVNLIRSLYVKSQFIASTSNPRFWWALQTENRVSYFWAIQNTPFESQGTELWEPIFSFGYFCLETVYNSCKLQSLSQAAKFFLCSPLLAVTLSFFSSTYL